MGEELFFVIGIKQGVCIIYELSLDCIRQQLRFYHIDKFCPEIVKLKKDFLILDYEAYHPYDTFSSTVTLELLVASVE